MESVFYLSSAISIVATAIAITRKNAVHALLYLILSLLAVSVVFYTIGAPFVAALEVIIYAGAIMVLFVFVLMMLNLGRRAGAIEQRWWTGSMWLGPSILALILLGEVAYLLLRSPSATIVGIIQPKRVGIALFGPYLIGVELASLLLLSGLVGTYHVGWKEEDKKELERGASTDELRIDAGRYLVHAGPGRPDREA
jgi:NADH-quinone oxidoreductase subunit J